MWVKYADQPIVLDRRKYEQRDRLSEYRKPVGFWITDDTDDCWRSWCVGEGFMLDGLTHKHQVELDERNVLILRSEGEVHDFSQKYGVPKHWGTGEKYTDWCIDWERVVQERDGLIITPYLWSLRMDLSWYYTWDCASGCIWNADAIQSVTLIGVDHDVAVKRESEAA